jgi:integrase
VTSLLVPLPAQDGRRRRRPQGRPEVNGAFSVGPPKSEAGRRTVILPAVVSTPGPSTCAPLHREVARGVHVPEQPGHTPAAQRLHRRVWQPAGDSLREVMDRLGHSTTVAAVRYQHVMADLDAAIARELNRLIEGA